jgi:hypothetical protein
LHAFIASLYELFLLADIRFFIQSTTCANICRLLIVDSFTGSAASAREPTKTAPLKAITAIVRFMDISPPDSQRAQYAEHRNGCKSGNSSASVGVRRQELEVSEPWQPGMTVGGR